jgi:pimeloyl-ACP methyl ester carboxylesterase
MPLELRSTGDGPAIVFLHGAPTPPEFLDPIADWVSAFGTAIRVSLPGYGTSPPLPAPFPVTRVHEAVEQALLARGVRDAAYVGFSGGAYHALALAHRAVVPARSLVLLAGFMGLDDAGRAAFPEFARLLRQGADLRSVAGPRFLSAGYRARHPERAVEVERWLEATSPQNLAAELDAFAAADDLTDAVRAMTCPLLARVGAEDAATPPPYSEAIVRAARSGTLQIVPGAGHALLIEDTAPTIDDVARFLSGHR